MKDKRKTGRRNVFKNSLKFKITAMSSNT